MQYYKSFWADVEVLLGDAAQKYSCGNKLLEVILQKLTLYVIEKNNQDGRWDSNPQIACLN